MNTTTVTNQQHHTTTPCKSDNPNEWVSVPARTASDPPRGVRSRPPKTTTRSRPPPHHAPPGILIVADRKKHLTPDMFPHQRAVHGREERFPDSLVSVDLIEAMTGLDFFQGMEGVEEMESEVTWTSWETMLPKGS